MNNPGEGPAPAPMTASSPSVPSDPAPPRLSVVIPLHNGLALTQRCLETLRATLPAGVPHEIILVDDGSTDGTRAWLATLSPTCQVVLNESNRGFAAACNRGAADARGEFLALLNNDLELTPGWLEPMLALLVRRPAVALVGNVQRRVADGAIDHAGIEVTAAAKLAHVTTLPRPGRRARDVFAVTAACCLLRTEDFRAAGGFDEEFLNGGEDIDLALKLRAGGRRVVVCLASVVRHHVRASRGPTSERDERNSRRLFQRWHKELMAATTQAWMRDAIQRARREPGSRRTALTCLPAALGWTQTPPLVARVYAAHAVFREMLRWRILFREQPEAGPPQAPGQYRHARFFLDETNSDTVWLRDRAALELPPGFPTRNFFLNGFLLPPDPDQPAAAGPLGLRLCVNGVQTATVFPLPEDHFNFGIDAPVVLPDQATRIDVELLGVRRTNFLAWLGRVIDSWPLPRRWRDAVGAYRRQALNRRLRISQAVADEEVIFEFKDQPALVPKLRRLGRPGGVNVIGWFRSALGLGESARCMAKACDAVGLPAALVELKLNCLTVANDDTFAARLQESNPYPVNIFHLDPPVGRDLDHHHGPAFRAGHYNIAYWAWELPEFPDAWVYQHQFFDEVWCPSEFTRAAIAAKLPKPVLAMPHAIDFPVPRGDVRARFSLPPRTFLFLFAYDLNSTQERKNPRAVIAAFRQAFPAGGPVGLVIKTHNPGRTPEALTELQAELAELPGAWLINETLSRTALYELQQACDCFVSLHRAEGFGLNVAEAMFLGKPVITTDWSGTAEFVNASNGCPVNYHLVTLERSYGPYARGQRWAEADVEHAAHWMRRLVEDDALRARLGAQAAADIRRDYSPTAIGRRYLRRLEAFTLW